MTACYHISMSLKKTTGNFTTLKKVLSFIYSRYAKYAVSRDILSVISSIAEILSITVFGKFIDATVEIFAEWDSFDLTAYIASESFEYLLFLLLLWICSQICSQGKSYLYTVISEKITKDSQHMLISKVAESNMEDVEKEDFQDMITYVPALSIGKIAPIYDYLSVILSNIIRFVGAVIIIYKIMGVSVFLIVLFVIPEAVIVHLKREEILRYQDESVGKLKFLNYIQNLSLTISNFLELRVNNVYSYLKRKYESEYDEYQTGYLKALSSLYSDDTAVGILGQCMKFGYVLYVLSVSIAKKVSFGTFKALYDYIDSAYAGIFNILNSISLIGINLGYVEKFFALVEYNCFGDKYHGDRKLGSHTPLLEFKNLSFAYPDDPETLILKNLNITIRPGEKVAFLGGDGSGKSTTVKILTGLYAVEIGDYLLDNIPTKELDRGELKKKLSVIFQDYINYNFSLKENVVISGQRKNVNEELYKKVTKIAGIEELKKVANIGDKSILGKVFPSGKDLSPGYWQRLAIARMLYRNKDIFIMDEPFTYVDDISAEKILNGIFEFAGEDRTIIYITRRTKFLEKFDRIYYFEKGKIIREEKWSEIQDKLGVS